MTDVRHPSHGIPQPAPFGDGRSGSGAAGTYRARLHAHRVAAAGGAPTGPGHRPGRHTTDGWRPIPTPPPDRIPSALETGHSALPAELLPPSAPARTTTPDAYAPQAAALPAGTALAGGATLSVGTALAGGAALSAGTATVLADRPALFPEPVGAGVTGGLAERGPLGRILSPGFDHPGAAAARHAYGPDGPADPPSYERVGEDPESFGDAVSLRSHWSHLDPETTHPPLRLRDRLPRGRRLVQLAVAVVALVVLGSGAGAGLLYARTDLDHTNADFTSNTTAIYFGDGKTALSTLAVQNRTTLPYGDIPTSMKNAAIAAENRSFWTDPGISVPGMARAAVATISGKQVQGGSTITQQYVKLVYLSQDRTLSRKIKEIAYALKLDHDRSKDRILGDYLNTVFFGRDAYGVQAAAQAWFGTDAKHLTVGQSAVLAAVIQNSSILDPSVDQDNLPRLQARYEYVLSGMREMGTITPAQYDEFHGHMPATPVQAAGERYTGPQGFLVNMVEQELTKVGFSEAQINGGGLRVTTTFDPKAQQAAEDAAQRYEQKAVADASGSPSPDLHAAIASVDSRTGEVLALYGGDDFVKNSRNWATTPRMTGSTFKAFGVVAGLRDGFTLQSTFKGNTFQLDRQPMPVRNEFNTNYGPAVSLQYATQESINTAFVDMVHQMQDGPKKVMKAANDAGAPSGTGWGNYDRMVLGEPEVSPLNMATAYATITNGGTRYAPHVVREVRDMNGTVLYSAETKGEQAIESDIANNATYALQQVTRAGTGTTAAALGLPVAGKTGTAGAEDKIYAAWFIGATTRVSTAVMYVAGADGQSDLDPYSAPGDQTFFGSGYPAKTWLSYMAVATRGDPAERFASPSYATRPRLRG
ncbi:transglycosylase domain-containing protein [Raineyella sp. LH-20]|uniref:transglycosylase domain-containing protein n=1 Tax=Raineyella sp. LH-20 TaxID=3081204 RepID=UPI002953E834|nr:transglycosylase domain-containing protein [Raineyella sp. LH-20]WOP20044.1 transglycosylase domain-containing protein [Raineyella sp. LH-20]